jgi:hypothetical protein
MAWERRIYMFPPLQKKILCKFIKCFILITIILIPPKASSQVRIDGYIRQYLDYRGQWNGALERHEVTPELLCFGGTRMYMIAQFGSINSPFYASFPFFFLPSVPQQGEMVIRDLKSSYLFLTRTEDLLMSLSSYSLSGNQLYSFRSLEDPLGTLKLPNTPNPVMTFKLNNKFKGWQIDGYYLVDQRCYFVPSKEMIPDLVFDVLGKDKDTMPYYDEAPTYQMARLSKKLDNDFNIGFIWGQKKNESIYPRSSYSENVVGSLNNKIGYIKENIGFDVSGFLPFLNQPTFIIAGINSSGEWRRVNNGEGVSLNWDNLGLVEGKASKISLDNIKLGTATVASDLVIVEPGFQWVAVRDSYHSYGYGYFNQEINNTSSPFGFRAVEDRDFLLRDSRRKEEYLSDVATFLGLRCSNISFSIPGAVGLGFSNDQLPSKLIIDIKSIDNLNRDEKYLDPYSRLELKNSYSSINTIFELDFYRKNIVSFYESLMKSSNSQDYKSELGLNWTSRPAPRWNIEGNLFYIKRLKVDDGYGEGVVNGSTFFLTGRTRKRALIETNVELRKGNYVFDLLEDNNDKVLNKQYSYIRFKQYVEFPFEIRIGTNQIRFRGAGEIDRCITSLPGLESGTSFIGYVGTNIAITKAMNSELTMVYAKGPQTESFASNKIKSLIDYRMYMRPFGKSPVVLSLTNRFGENLSKTNLRISWDIRTGRHRFTFSYGSAPWSTGIPSYVAGTPRDSRYIPDSELSNKIWSQYGEKFATSSLTRNLYNLSWIVYF